MSGMRMNSNDDHIYQESVTIEEEGKRIDKSIADWIDFLSRTKAQEIIKEGRGTVNGKKVKPSYRLQEGDVVYVDYTLEKKEGLVRPQPISLEIVYEDHSIVSVDKPSSMVVHPGAGHPDGTLVNALLHHCGPLPEVDDPRRPGIVHRLDKETSGVMVVAKTRQAYDCLVEQFKKRCVEKEYIAVVQGTFEEDEGVIEAPVGRDQSNKTNMTVTLGGKPAKTEFWVEKRGEDATLLRVRPRTGRTHQIRVHFQYIGHPVLGDVRYGDAEGDRLMLHSRSLGITHPDTGEEKVFEAPIPQEFGDWF